METTDKIIRLSIDVPIEVAKMLNVIAAEQDKKRKTFVEELLAEYAKKNYKKK